MVEMLGLNLFDAVKLALVCIPICLLDLRSFAATSGDAILPSKERGSTPGGGGGGGGPGSLQLASVDPTAASSASGNVPRQAFGHLLAHQKGGDLSNVDLLALKVDNTLMRSLSQWLSKYDIQLPSTLVEKIDQLELCPDDAKDGLPHYCTKMADGPYYDPWNPWCGYIECLNGLATRKVCRPGTWIGFGRNTGRSVLMNKDDMCRRLLTEDNKIRTKTCTERTEFNLCSMAVSTDI